MKRALYITLVIIGSLLVLIESAMLICANVTTGVLLSLFSGAVMLCWGIWHDNINALTSTGVLKAAKYALFSGTAILVGIAIFAGIMGAATPTKFDEDAIIVLGAGINGETILESLQLRLDAALLYLEKNKTALVVVSGGQGPQESITEALAMERYLINKGVDKSRIIKEEEATSTFENFVYSKRLLDSRIKQPYRIAYVTNDFHLYRAGELARHAGLNAAGLGTSTKWYIFISSYLREALAVIKLWIWHV